MKDLRTRRGVQPEVDLDGPDTWTRGGAWDGEPILHRPAPVIRHDPNGSRPR